MIESISSNKFEASVMHNQSYRFKIMNDNGRHKSLS